MSPDPVGPARAAEALVLDRADRLTPGGLRAAIARAVMEVAPQKARKRREEAARDARVDRWAEDSGNAALAGRELPPAEVLAAHQRVTWWAQQLKKAGLAGDMDQLRARAFLDILLDVDSRPDRPGAATADGKQDGPDGPHGGPDDRQGGPDGGPDGETKGQAAGERADCGPDARTDGGGGDSSGPDSRGCARPGPAGPGGPTTPGPGRTRPGATPPGFVGRVMLTVPLTTVLHLADRPGEIPGIGPVEPDPRANTPNRYRAGT